MVKMRRLWRFTDNTIKQAIKAVVYGSLGGFCVGLIVFVLYLQDRQDLSVWHTVELDAEFTEHSPIRSFADYLALEARLFAQLDEQVYARVEPEGQPSINRYQRGSLSDPSRWSPNWNRTFELPAKAPSIGVLLLHGMSDSPYSLRSIGQRLQAEGTWVVGLRLPGHGTAPSGLVEVRWQDMAAAVRLAVRHLRDKVGERPLYIAGYSNGGALAVHYALTALEDETLPPIRGLVLISPAIGVSKLAVLAVWQARLGHLLGLEKLAWNSILPEYDPFKYGSFAVNAGDQVYRLTTEIQSRLERLGATGDLARLPPILAFQSAVDATVSATALVEGLFMRLPAAGHELVMFDINRVTDIEQILQHDPRAYIEAMLRDPSLHFTRSLITNQSETRQQVSVRRRSPGDARIVTLPLNMAWPGGLYSLAHVALPFPGNDALYGGDDSGDSPGISLGSMALRGERGVLQIPAADMLRLRWNPFYPYLERRLLAFLAP